MKPTKKYVLLSEAAGSSSYSQEYLSLLARKKKLFAKKIGRNWYTTKEAVDGYIKKQENLKIFVPGFQKPLLITTENLQSELLKPKSLIQEFEKLNLPEKTFQPFRVVPKPAEKKSELIPVPSGSIGESPTPVYVTNEKIDVEDSNVSEKLDALLKKVSAGPQEQLTADQKYFLVSSSQSKWFKFWKFNSLSRELLRDPKQTLVILVGAVVFLFLLAGGFSFGQIDNAVQRVKQIFTDAETLGGHFPGTHANEVLILDKAGNISIYGHIETQGQLRSYAEQGVAPIVVDSITKVDNLNVDYLDGLDSADFTLAFVTKNGNITYEDVFLEGNVEVGKTLLVKGPTKLLDSLTVHGELGVFGQAIFGKDVKLTSGNLVLDTGTIKINNTQLIENLNADKLDYLDADDFTLDQVLQFGDTARRMAFFEAGLWAKDGAFGSLGVKGNVSIGNESDPDDSRFVVFSKKFKVDENGRVTTKDLVVDGRLFSNLIPSGSYDLGSSVNPWDEINVSSASFSTLTITGTGGGNFEGTTSSSFRINTDNATADTEDSYISFERGTKTPNAIIKWDSTNKQFSINQPFKVASTSFELVGTASISGDLIVYGSGSAAGQLKATRAPVTAHTGTWPNFAGTGNATLYVNPSSSVADGNLFVAAIADTPKFVVDAEGDIFAAGNLTLSGTTTQSTTNITGDLTVEGNSTLGDAQADIIKLSGTIRPRTLTSFPVLVKASASQTVDVFRVLDPNDNILLTIDQGTGLLTASSGFNFALGGSTATVSYSRLGTVITGHSSDMDKFNDLLISGSLEVDGNAFFDSNASVSGRFELTSATSRLAINAGAFTDTMLEVGGTVSISGATTLRGVTYTWPSADGSANQFLRTNGSGTLAWATAGVASNSLDFDEFVNSMTLDANLTINRGTGNYFIGIGAAPSTVFEVQGTASASYLLTGNTLQVGGFASAAYSRFGTNTTTHAGTISGISDLLVSGGFEVNGSAAFDGLALFARGASFSGNLTPTTDALYDLGASSSTNKFRWRNGYFSNQVLVGSTTAITTSSVSSDASLFEIENRSNNPIKFSTNLTERMRIAADGNVGIGTTSPASLLSIYNSTATASFDIASLGQTDKRFTILSNTTGSGADSERLEIRDNANRTLATIASSSGLFSIKGPLTALSGNNLKLQASGTATGSTGSGSIYFFNSSGTTRGRIDTAIGTFSATGGTKTTDGSYEIRTFTSSGTLTFAGTGSVSYLVVAGGGGGGTGGGGAGGMLTGSGFTVTASAYSITVGTGGTAGAFGASNGGNGGDSIFSTNSATGGGGGANSAAGLAGGSGGGAGTNTDSWTGGAGTAGQGSAGGNNHIDGNGAGGGGGKGAVGANATTNGGGNGGTGTASSISGSSVTYAGGGGGSAVAGKTAGTGGAGGGGNGGVADNGTAGTVNRGGGGGGGYGSGKSGGAGGSGIVVIRFKPVTTDYGTLYIGSTNTTSADLAEYYVSHDSSLSAGDVVSIDFDGSGYGLVKARDPDPPLGIISTNPGFILGGGEEDKSNQRLVALAGRVPAKVSNENGPIKVGDRLAISKTDPGIAVKANKAGDIVGIALENFGDLVASSSFENIASGSFSDLASGSAPVALQKPVSYGTILTFVNVGYWAPDPTQLAINNQYSATASESSNVIVVSSIDFGEVALSSRVVFATIIETVLTKVQNLWAMGDVIVEGIKKTYYSVSSAFDWEFDLATMAQNWLTREISISPSADDATRNLLSGQGAQAAAESRLDLAENGNYLATYGIDSTRGEIALSGSSEISGGEAKIFFDFSFTSVISDKIPLKVLVTPTTTIQGQLYVADKTPYGFIVKSLNGSGDGKFDWLVIARRKGYEGEDISKYQNSDVTPSPTPSPSEPPTLESSSSPSPIPEISPSPSESPGPSPEPSPSEPPTPSPEPTSETTSETETLVSSEKPAPMASQ